MDLKELEDQVIKEEKELEAKAFELFVKDFIKQDLESVKRARDNLEKVMLQKEERDLEYYKKTFNGTCHNSSGFRSYKEEYIEKVK